MSYYSFHPDHSLIRLKFLLSAFYEGRVWGRRRLRGCPGAHSWLGGAADIRTQAAWCPSPCSSHSLSSGPCHIASHAVGVSNGGEGASEEPLPLRCCFSGGEAVRPTVLSLPQCAAWSAGPGGLAGLRGSPQVVTCGLRMWISRGLLPASHHNRTGLVLSLYLMPTHFTGGHKCPPAHPPHHPLGRDCGGGDTRTRPVSGKSGVPPTLVSAELSA